MRDEKKTKKLTLDVSWAPSKTTPKPQKNEVFEINDKKPYIRHCIG